jgi:Tfp pilus assembly protein PilO
VSPTERPAWHWDEQQALREELAAQSETAAVIEAALRAEIAELTAKVDSLERQLSLTSRALCRALSPASVERARE